MVAEAASPLLASHPPIKVFYYHYHNSIRSELDELSAAVAALENASVSDASDGLASLKRRVAFLDRVYSIHSSVEDEVVYPALDLKVKNVTHAYSVEHEDEERLIEQLSQAVSASMLAEGKQKRATIRQLMCKVQEIRTTLLKHLAKEEEQLFPLLLKHFTYSEQAQLVAQLLCCIPLTSVEPVLTWLTSAMPQSEQKDLLLQIQQVVPDSMLLQLLVAWLSPGSRALPLGTAGALDIASVRPWKEGPQPECCREALGLDPLDCPLARPGSKGPADRLKSSKADHAPLKHIAHVHAAIRSALDAFASEAASLAGSNESLKPAALGALVERLRFLRAVCSYHSASEDDVLFPAVRLLSTEHEASGCLACEADHEHEGALLEDVARLLGDVRASVRRGAQEVHGLIGNLRAAADAARSAITGHMAREEADVLPLLEARLCAGQQRDMVWRTLQAMPLRLLERVLPWLAEKLTEEEARAMLQDLQLAAPADEGPLVQLLSRWAERGRQDSPEPQGQDDPKQYSNSTCGVHLMSSAPAASSSGAAERPAKRRRGQHGQLAASELHASSAEAADLARHASGHISADETHAMPAIHEEAHAESSQQGRPASPRTAGVNPIDHIFQFHKALRRDLRALEEDARSLAVELEDAAEWNPGSGSLQQLEGRFRCLAGMYKAHSQAEDEIIFPALEAKEALCNVSHAYTLDHQQEEELFDGLRAAMDAIRASAGAEEARKHASALQRLTAATRASMEQHVRAEEQEVWPLFAEHFTEQEQEHLVGQIVGRTGAEVLQAMLPWVTESFTEQEQRNMMESLRSATRNTGFERWLDATLRPQPQADLPAAQPGDSPKAGGSSQQGSHHGSDLALAEVAEYLASDANKLPSMGSLGSTSAEPHVFRPGWEDIFRMNQKQLEEAMRKIHNDGSLDQQRKAYLSQNIMASKYIVAQQRRMHANTSCSHGVRSYADAGQSVLGCSHYQRGCQVLAPCCGQMYPCKKCHDHEEDHQLEQQSVQSMVCMACGLRQPSGASCCGCGKRMARYYCGICHLWDDAPGRSIYHCPFCNLCRLGRGLGLDACHCMDCNTCMSLAEYPTHQCRGLAACPVCTDALFESSQPYRELPCGHFMHSHCFAQYTRYNYTCPVCSKSMGDMSIYFGMLDSIVARDLADLPAAYRTRQHVLLAWISITTNEEMSTILTCFESAKDST